MPAKIADRFRSAAPWARTSVPVLQEPVDGRQVVAVVTGPGSMELMAPSLNFYPLVRTHASTGERMEAHVISTEEPAAELFEPPAGVEIRRSDKPAGIVMETRAEAEARGATIGKPDQHDKK